VETQPFQLKKGGRATSRAFLHTLITALARAVELRDP
jgi:hypothetical protein